ncbi:MAG: PaaI family thioesterase, partial [Actinomycetota bacterium]
PLTEADNLRIDLTEATRELIRESFVSTASDEDMQAAIDAVRAAAAAVARATGRDVGAFNSNFMDRSPFMGLMNPLAPPMVATLDRTHGEFGAVIGTVTFREPHEGPPGHVHGGFLAGVFDEILGQAQSLSGRPGMTGKLSISYRSPTPLYRELTVRGWIDRIDGRKIFTKGTLHNGDTLCCESEGLFISMPAEHMHLLRKGRDEKSSTVPEEVKSRMAAEKPQQ